MSARRGSQLSCYFRVVVKLMLIFLRLTTAKGKNCADKTIGLEFKSIFPDSRFNASSYYVSFTYNYKPWEARLLSSTYGWIPETSSPNEYLQIDLGLEYFICAVATQGGMGYWVKTYKIMFSLDNKNWTTYRENEHVKNFTGNTDASTLVKRSLNKPVVRYIRFIPILFYQWKVMKVGLYGYTIPEACITNPLGMESGAIPDSHITASSSQQPASNARLQSTSSWCASSRDSSPYLQIDLGSDHVICAVATQGNSAADQWVTSYQVSAYSNESSWRLYTENNMTRTFYGNYDRSTMVRRVFYQSPILRYIRFQHETYKNTACLRTEIYGYKLQPSCSRDSVGILSSILVPDHRFTASSYYNSYYKPYKGRLGSGLSWRASTTSNSYLQIDLGSVFYLCAVSTQGHRYWVKNYKITFSDDNRLWTAYSDTTGNEKEFKGNTDKSTVVTNVFKYPFRAKFVRVLPTAFYYRPTLRVDFKGSVSGCSSPLGLENLEIPNSQMTSSSDNTHDAPRGRLYGSSAWCSSTTSNTQYIQVDLGEVKTVTGIATQGDPTQKKWVTSYNVTYSFTGRDWYEYREGEVTKIFTGNKNRNDVIVNWLSRPIAARYVRVLPQTSNGRHCLRFDLYGCDFAISPTAVLDTTNVILPSTNGVSKTLTCTAIGQPPPDIQWFGNGTKIPGATRSTLQVQFISAEDVVSKYRCTRQDPDTRPRVCKTNYTCRVAYPVYVPSAALSNATATVTVNLNVPAQQSFSVSPNKRSIRLSWTGLSTDDVGKITLYTIELHNMNTHTTRHVLHPITSYVLSYLTPYTNYTIRMSAISTVGQGLWSKPTTVTTLIAEPEGTPSITSVLPESSQSMRIKWKFNKHNTLNGPMAGYVISYTDEEGQSQTKRVGVMTTTLLTSLKKYMTYVITVSVRNTMYRGPESGAVSKRTLEDAPDCSPILKSAQSLTSTSIQVTWDALPNTTCRNGILKGYKILYRKESESKATEINTRNLADLSRVIQGLEKYTRYRFEVLGYTIEDGQPSNAIHETTLQDAPTAPRNVKGTVFPPRGDFRIPRLRITWDKPLEENGIIQRYTIVYQYGNDISTQRKVNITNIDSLTFTLNVLGEARFGYKVSASTVKEGPYTQYQSGYIPAYRPAIAPRRVRYSKLNETTFKITWQPLLRNESNGVILSYNVSWTLKHIGRITRMASGEEFTGTTQGTQFLIPNLRLCAQYEISVAALTRAGAGPNATVSITTSQPGEPLNLRSLEEEKTYVYLKWDKPIGITQGMKSYKIEIAGSKPSYWPEYSFARTDRQDGGQTELKVVNLQPGTKYEFLVIASTVCGESNKSLPATAITDVDKPVKPQGKPVSLKDSLNVTLWTIEPRNGPISSYQVIVAISNKKSKINIPDILYDYKQAKEKNLHVYITAELTPDQLTSRVFEIGDGKMYGKYRNVPLEKGKTYTIAERAITRDKGTIYTSEIAQVAEIKLSADQTTSHKSKDETSGNGAAIGGVVAVLLIILILAGVGFVVYKKRRAKRDEENTLALDNITYTDRGECDAEGIEINLIQDQEFTVPPDSIDKKHHENFGQLNKECAQSEERDEKDTTGFLKEDKVIYEAANGTDARAKPMPVRQFVEHMRSLKATKYAQLENEFKDLLNAYVYPAEIAKKPDNKKKNRYGNIVTYDHSRVVINRSGNEHSDYVNASYVNGYDESTRTYIAAQGPVPLTFADFWQMIWEQNTHTIVMLTNLQEGNKTKCHQYWPDSKESYRDITVSTHKTEIFPDYVIRTFLLTKTSSEKTRHVHHFQFTVWPDKGVPHHATTVVALRRKVKAINPPNAGPVVVHCSAGVGRTGAYIVIDAMLERAKVLKNVDISNYVASIRKDRPYMVQTSEQYVFIHLAIYEVFTCGNTEIQACNLHIAMNKLATLNKQKNATGYALEYERLNKVTGDYAQDECNAGNKEANATKNRYKDGIVLNRTRVLLSRHGEDTKSDYINASHVDAYKERNAFIVTQAPLQNTIEEFWIMVINYEVGTIVMLNTLEEGNERFPQYWPQNGGVSYGKVSVELQNSQTIGELLISRRFLVTYESTELHVTHLQALNWVDKCVPTNKQGTLDLLKEVEQSQRQTKNTPVVVQCSNGVGRSGTFCAIASIVERAKEEQIIDVFQAIKRIRGNRPGAVETLAQYTYCYQMAQNYLDSFNEYANFAIKY